MCVSVVGSVVSILSPDGESGGISKNIRLIFGLCVVIVCINPIKDMFSYIKDMKYELNITPPDNNSEKYEEIFDGAYSSAEIANLKNGIKQMLNDRFAIDPIECEIAIALSDSGDLKRIFVTLYGSAVWKNTDEIESYLGGVFSCEIITAIG